MEKQIVEKLVKAILEDCPEARDDDNILMVEYCRKVGYDINTPYAVALLTGSPNRDTVTRVRRKVQERNPDLRPSENVKGRRKKAEDDWKEYVRS